MTVIIHIGRHTFACLAIEYGMPIDIITKVLGHSNVNMTRHYAKFSEDAICRAMFKLGTTIGQTKPNADTLVTLRQAE